MSDEQDDRTPVPNDVLASGQLRCSACERMAEAATSVGDEVARPKEGDQCMCWDCGELSAYARTTFGVWRMRALTPQEQQEADADPGIADVRRRMLTAKRQGRGPLSVGEFAGGKEPPPDPAVMVCCEPVSWEATAAKWDLATGEVVKLQRFTAQRFDAGRVAGVDGVVQLSCRACELPVLAGPEDQRAVFELGAQALCVVCAVAVAARQRGQDS